MAQLTHMKEVLSNTGSVQQQESDDELVYLPVRINKEDLEVVNEQEPEYRYQYRLNTKGPFGKIRKNFLKSNFYYYQTEPNVQDLVSSEDEDDRTTYKESWV